MKISAQEAKEGIERVPVMIKNFDFDNFSPFYSNYKISDMGKNLARYQRKLLDLGIPVMIIIEGWESSGNEHIINDLIRELNPRNHHVREYDYLHYIDNEKPFMWKYWRLIPKKGDMTILDRSYYFNLLNNTKISKSDLNTYNDIIESFEKQLIDDNMIIIKFFLHLDKKTHKERLRELKKDEHRSFFITEIDEKQYKNYKEYNEHMDKILKNTNFDFAPWNVISAQDLKEAGKEVLGITKKAVREKIENVSLQKEFLTEITPFVSKGIINNLDLSLRVDEDIYDSTLEILQNKASEITYKLYNKNIPTILAFEGMDAAGKGGAIQRLTRLMDARFYDVVAISSPTETENQYHYLWRFFKEFPSRGKIKLFDRSWYGRVLVERVEGFASEAQWRRAYNEINQMERELYNEGALIIKFLIVIDKDEQLSRFKDRKNDLDKVYKLTDEDWRNRDKWSLYVEAMDEMLEKTNSEYAPWIIVEGNDKKYARLKVLSEFIKRAEKIISRH